MQWREQAQRYLYDREVIEESVSLDNGASGVVVTSHRVLAFTPETDGPNYQHVERPNVESVTIKDVGNTSWLEYALKGLIGGGLAAIAGWQLELADIIDMQGIETTETSQLGVGGVMGTMTWITNLVTQLDELLMYLGLFAFVFGMGSLGWYLDNRQQSLVIDIAGEEDLHIPVTGDGKTETKENLAQLQHALQHEPSNKSTESVETVPASQTE